MMAHGGLVNSQTVCDSVEIILVNVDAFANNQLNLRVVNNNTQELFDYPGFRVYDENDNLIGEEEVFFFGIGGESTHVITFDESAFPFAMGQNYNFKIELWKNFYDEMVCEFEVNYAVIPQIIDCVDIELTFTEFSQEQVTYEILLTDYSGNEIHSETLVYAPTVASISRNFCVPPSCYYMTVSSNQASDVSNLFMSSSALSFYGFDNIHILEQQTESTVVFSIWTDCSLLNSTEEILNFGPLVIYPNPVADVLFLNLDEDIPTEIEIFNSAGQIILRSQNANAHPEKIDLSNLPSGFYFIKLTQMNAFKTVSFIKN